MLLHNITTIYLFARKQSLEPRNKSKKSIYKPWIFFDILHMEYPSQLFHLEYFLWLTGCEYQDMQQRQNVTEKNVPEERTGIWEKGSDGGYEGDSTTSRSCHIDIARIMNIHTNTQIKNTQINNTHIRW